MVALPVVDEVGADEAGAAGDQDVAHGSPSLHRPWAGCIELLEWDCTKETPLAPRIICPPCPRKLRPDATGPASCQPPSVNATAASGQQAKRRRWPLRPQALPLKPAGSPPPPAAPAPRPTPPARAAPRGRAAFRCSS